LEGGLPETIRTSLSDAGFDPDTLFQAYTAIPSGR
jgi:hypothetical protein